MNILPIVLALVLVLSAITIERMEKFKNQAVIQKEQQAFIKNSERKEFNKRQASFYDVYPPTHRQLSFRYIVNKELREKNSNIAKQYRQMNIDLIKVLYSEAAFYKNMENKNSKFAEELIAEIENSADHSKGTIRTVRDICRLVLSNPEMQRVFYKMLKGTIERSELNKCIEDKNNSSKAQEKLNEKTYVSLLTYIHLKETPPMIQLAPKELLKAIFESNDVVDLVLERRQELSKNKASDSAELFKKEFNPRRKIGISDELLDFSISKSDKKIYD